MPGPRKLRIGMIASSTQTVEQPFAGGFAVSTGRAHPRLSEAARKDVSMPARGHADAAFAADAVARERDRGGVARRAWLPLGVGVARQRRRLAR
ncbi:MAG: hypothetical protein JWO14_778 [Solirubrobacterales bacterium]|nr:hypothetical protein [Solirubrobacterales bacterium]